MRYEVDTNSRGFRCTPLRFFFAVIPHTHRRRRGLDACVESDDGVDGDGCIVCDIEWFVEMWRGRGGD